MHAYPRVIPCLLLKEGGLVKGQQFRKHQYIGDPINAIRIYNEMEVDELLFLDIDATPHHRGPDLGLIERLAEECYMPFGVGGGISTLEQAREVLYAGAEKVVINSALSKTPQLITQCAQTFGSQAVVASVDIKKNIFGKYQVYTHQGLQKQNQNVLEYCEKMAHLGAGEILLTSIYREGTMQGMDLELIRSISHRLDIPLIASGGAGSLTDIQKAIHDGGASAVSAGSLFVYHNQNRAVLINYPDRSELNALFATEQTQ